MHGQTLDNETISRRIAAMRLLRRGYQQFRSARLQWRLARQDAIEHLGDDDARALLRGWTSNSDAKGKDCGGHVPNVFKFIQQGKHLED